MRVLGVAFSEIPVGTAVSAGAEQILSMLDEGLVERGHESVVVAAVGSRSAGHLIESGCHREAIDRVLAAGPVDLIHFHGIDFMDYLPEKVLPMMATLHLPITCYPPGTIECCRSRGMVLNCVSMSQARSSPVLGGLPVIDNGIPTNVYAPGEPGGYALWLGRICPEKGTHIALEAAHRLDIPLVVAGPVHPYAVHQQYFSRCVEPRLDDRRRYVGPIGLEEKRKLLSGADCLLLPCLAPETSSLVAMEALSCGTPVIAFRQGAVHEIVDEDETGFIVDSLEEMCQAIPRASDLSRRLCRERAIDRFDSRRMIDEYLRLYQGIVTGLLFRPHRVSRQTVGLAGGKKVPTTRSTLLSVSNSP